MQEDKFCVPSLQIQQYLVKWKPSFFRSTLQLCELADGHSTVSQLWRHSPDPFSSAPDHRWKNWSVNSPPDGDGARWLAATPLKRSVILSAITVDGLRVEPLSGHVVRDALANFASECQLL